METECVTHKEYTDARIEDLRTYVDALHEADERARQAALDVVLQKSRATTLVVAVVGVAVAVAAIFLRH